MTLKLPQLNKKKAREEFEKIFSDTNGIPESIITKIESSEYADLRQRILEIRKQIDCPVDTYEFDYRFALSLYQLFIDMPEFNETIASDYDIWRGISLRVVPDIVFERHGKSEVYFYSKNNRIYLSTLWWYIHLSYQGTIEATRHVLADLTTDYIMQLVDRASSNGVYLETSRLVMKYLGTLPDSVRNKRINGNNLFRRVMMQDVARRQNYNLIFENDPETYVKQLYEQCEVTING